MIGLILGATVLVLATFTGSIIDDHLSSVGGFKYYSPGRLCLLQVLALVVYTAIACAVLFFILKNGVV